VYDRRAAIGLELREPERAMAPRRQDSCYFCRFWVGEGLRERGPKGTCHRYPPTVTARAPGGVFPVTHSADWCGEWQRTIARAPVAPGEEAGPGPGPGGDMEGL